MKKIRGVSCPECKQGKCRNCDGEAWSDEVDGPVPCDCAARGHTT